MNADDLRLINECLQGQTEAFGELVHLYQDRLYNTVFRLMGNAEDAQDVVQETFLSAYQSLPNFKGDSLFFTWIYRIAINTAISLKRKQKTTISINAGGEKGSILDPLDTSEFSQPEHAMEVAEEEIQIQKALNQLSAEHRTVLVMKDIDGHKYEAMAEVLKVPIGTIRSRLHRARLELRELLLKEEKDSESKTSETSG